MSEVRIPNNIFDLNRLPEEEDPDEQSLDQLLQLRTSGPNPMIRSPIQSHAHDLTLSNVPDLNLSNVPDLNLSNVSSPNQAMVEHDQLCRPQAVTISKPTHRVRGQQPSARYQGRRKPSRRVLVEIEPPYPWATNKPAVIKSKRDLCLENINVISGQVFCKSCDKIQTLEYNLEDKFLQVSQFIIQEKREMRHRSPEEWQLPELIKCETCKAEMKPKTCDSKEKINWLFLLLGQMLGCLKLEDLKFFCKCNAHHSTGSKIHVLYLTYLGLCKQLDPNGPFDP